MTVHCRIMKTDIEKFQCDLSCRGSELRDDEGRFSLQMDTFYDHEAEVLDKQKSSTDDKKSNRASTHAVFFFY